MVFRGLRTHDNYSGKAFAFSPGCPVASYDVTGVVSNDQRQVTLQGQAPVRDIRCRTTGRQIEVLTFVFHDAEDNWGEPR